MREGKKYRLELEYSALNNFYEKTQYFNRREIVNAQSRIRQTENRTRQFYFMVENGVYFADKWIQAANLTKLLGRLHKKVRIFLLRILRLKKSTQTHTFKTAD